MDKTLNLGLDWQKDYEYVASNGDRRQAFIFTDDSKGKYPIGAVIGKMVDSAQINPNDDEYDDEYDEEVMYFDVEGNRLSQYKKNKSKIAEDRTNYLRVKEPVEYRGYTDTELQSLVGRVITSKSGERLALVVNYEQGKVWLGKNDPENWLAANNLLDHWLLDGKPCGVVSN